MSGRKRISSLSSRPPTLASLLSALSLIFSVKDLRSNTIVELFTIDFFKFSGRTIILFFLFTAPLWAFFDWRIVYFFRTFCNHISRLPLKPFHPAIKNTLQSYFTQFRFQALFREITTQ
ncbi:hypothetical protein CROQUDRAFT_90594 [Cronartium quercuum f. sp. fusiforme G11]|uniref:Uncharacterized protein n=1 Tax=Cronartium quercuum f. sp. fusiforme G11 TaxID=708437 RepID=A0A9P6NLP3_9BASI|nr:hypothetical protein CROQUDRAFT_90594 [Cronartium quercuum f. sp. fusiforme G11]